MKAYFRISLPIPDEWKDLDFRALAIRRWPHVPLNEQFHRILRGLASQEKTKEPNPLPYPWYDSGEIGEKEQQGSSWETIHKNRTHIIWARGQAWICPCARNEPCVMPEGKE